MDIINTIGILDLIFMAVLAISILIGIIRGVIREVLSLVGLLASIYLAFRFSDSISTNYTFKFFEDQKISYIVTFILIIVSTLFCVTLINLFCTQFLQASGLSYINRFLGAIFGLLRGALICSILVMIVSFIPGTTTKPWWKASSLAPVFKNLTRITFTYLPKEISDYLASAKKNANSAASALGVPIATEQKPSSNELDKQTQSVLKSIEESRQDSEKDTSHNKKQLRLESYQEQ